MATRKDREWMAEFRRRTAVERIPVSGILELTSRCNLKCVHCYLGPQEEQRAKRDLEMSTDQVKAVIDDIVANGCLYLVITGGDPMVRQDFPEIYRYAKEQGLIVTIFCDGVLINDRIIQLFREYPPFSVDVSLYGATAGTYEAVTRIKGSFAKCMRGIERLRKNAVAFSLKTVILSINRHEVSAMRQLAQDLGVKFRTDSAVFPCLPNNDHTPLDLRVAPQEAVEIELEDPVRLEQWIHYTERQEGGEPSDLLYNCGAGVTNFYVDPFGFASPCLMTTQYRYSLKDRDFASLWSRELVQLRRKKPRADYGCNVCEVRSACTGCPAFNFQENGQEDIKSEYVCETTQHRWEKIQSAKTARLNGSCHSPGSALVGVDRQGPRPKAQASPKRRSLPILSP